MRGMWIVTFSFVFLVVLAFAAFLYERLTGKGIVDDDTYERSRTPQTETDRTLMRARERMTQSPAQPPNKQ